MTAPYGYAPPATVNPTVQRDLTAVLGRRIGAYFVDLIPSLFAIVVFFVIFFGAATTIEGAGLDFCDRINDTIFSFEEDPLVQKYDDGHVCVQSNRDAIVVPNADFGRALGVGGLVWLLSLVNQFVVQGITGATFGKHMLRLRVVREDGQLAGFGRNAGRTLMFVVDGFCGGLVGLVTVLATTPHRRVGDMVAGTYVVHKDSVGTPLRSMAPIAAAAPVWQPPAPAGLPVWPPTATAAPPAATPPTWGPPADAPAPAPAPDATSPATAVAPTDPSPSDLPPGAEMRWDERWNAWLYWDPASQRWLRHDTGSNQWIPM